VPRRSFLSSVASGAAVTAAGLWASSHLEPPLAMVRVERSIRIARSAEEVYSAFAQLKRMPRFTRSVLSVDACGDVSVWIAQIDGRRYRWDVEIVQVVPKQVIAWRSFCGSKHSGRVSFLSLGDHTVVQVEMSYVPSGVFGGVGFWKVADAISAVLNDLKVMIETARLGSAVADESGPLLGQATGT